MAEDTADVLIVGAGAAGAAMAWSLSDTGMRIVCLEQGDWMDPAEYPTTASRDWELRRFGDFGLSPEFTRGRRGGLPHKRLRTRRSQISNFNAVGGSTILYAAHFPRFRPSDFKRPHLSTA